MWNLHPPIFIGGLVRICDLPTSNKVSATLFDSGIKYVHQLVAKRKEDLLAIKGFGPRSLTEVVRLLEEYNLRLGMEVNASDPIEVLVEQYKHLPRNDQKKFLDRTKKIFVEEALMRGPPIPEGASDDTAFYMKMGKIMGAVYADVMEE